MIAREDAVGLVKRLSPSLGETDALALYHEHAQSEEARNRLAEWAKQEQGDAILESARRVLLPGLLIAEAKYLEVPRQWSGIFERLPSIKNPERFAEISLQRLPQIRPNNAPIVRDNNVGERFVYQIEKQELALETCLSQEFFDGGAIPVIPFAGAIFGLGAAFVQAEEILHANVLNTGMVYNPTIAGDGAPLFWQRHPHDDGEYSNILEAAPGLNKGAIESACALIREMPGANGIKLHARAKALIVPIALEFAVHRLMADATLSYAVPGGYQVMDFLTDPRAWFVKTSIAGLISVHWKPYRLDLRVEDGALVMEATQTYAPGYINPRACVASFPKGVEA